MRNTDTHQFNCYDGKYLQEIYYLGFSFRLPMMFIGQLDALWFTTNLSCQDFLSLSFYFT